MENNNEILEMGDFQNHPRMNFSGFLEREKQIGALLQKSHIIETIRRSEAKFPKSGKELREKVQVVIAAYKAKKEACKAELDALIEKVGFAPTVPVKGFYGLGESLLSTFTELNELKNYHYKFCHPDSHAVKDSPGTINPMNSALVSTEEDNSSSLTKEQSEACAKYNDKMFDYVRCCKDCATLEVFHRNLDEKKTYELSSSELITFGF